ncbi:PaaI family thioesterase [Actinopolyspora halophila]|uniref:PaaI family thioesterase n=1 Tax=Actinopolyspora halophila TaxID=1850 RepID=UPI0003639310|nr:hotdog fold thioesterase [Actinopolyspora halophila]
MSAVDEDGAVHGSAADQLREALSGTEQLVVRMGLEITAWNPDHLVGTLPVAGNRQPYGLLHGGANAVLAETLGSIAAALHTGASRQALGVDLSCTHHRSPTGQRVTGTATPLHRGRNLATYEITINDDDGNRTCTARLTCVLREHPSHPLPS